MLTFKTVVPEETIGLGEILGNRISHGLVIALDGELGAGKTHFVKGLAKGLGSTDLVTSPTFTLLHLYYGGRLNLAHFDAFRLKGPRDMEALDYEEYFYGPWVSVVEWAELVWDCMPEEYLEIRLSGFSDQLHEEGRTLTMEAYGDPLKVLLKELNPFACSGD